MADDECSDLPDDALVQVLLHLRTSSRRRFSLVCKHWCGLIDERTPEWRARAGGGRPVAADERAREARPRRGVADTGGGVGAREARRRA
ncbi:unnamed protein product [Urochloa humidicola]